MKTIPTVLTIAALTSALVTTSVTAATDEPQVDHQTAQTAPEHREQAKGGKQGMGMRARSATPGYIDQMKAMQEMHGKMQAAKTPEEQKALISEHMALMQKGMHMMEGMRADSGMGAGSGMSTSDNMAACHSMMENHMKMMQSMMQMKMDGMGGRMGGMGSGSGMGSSGDIAERQSNLEQRMDMMQSMMQMMMDHMQSNTVTQ